eukprot:TRINITY_DN4436_c0_g1_i1.p1 TRINITY_DN4436_c0_g1~~TRINITY_DN4436_c0_g1_i1.p1  ORF type:complete len:395 (+),score=61.95 TRINITY_DN4436_c0_g1_i1:47-1186(+)
MVPRLCVLLAVVTSSVIAIGNTSGTTTTTVIKYYNDLLSKLPSQHGKCIAITGTTSGLGYWAAVASARKGASCVIMLNRKSSRADAAEVNVKKEAVAGVDVVTVISDLQNLSSVREAAANVNRIASKYGGLDVLATNAGIMDMPDQRTADGFDLQMQTNHLAHFLLTKLVMPSLQKAAATRGEARIVTHSSAARGGGPANASYFSRSKPGTLGGDSDMQGMARYHQTKLANIVFSMRLHSKLVKAGISNLKSLSAAPGISATELHVPGSYPDAAKRILQKYVVLSAPDGSCSLVTAMLDPSAKSGDFYEPKYIANGPPSKVIDQSVPSFWSEIPRKVFGIKDTESCMESTGDAVWSYTENGLGEKFPIEPPLPSSTLLV